jgi:hypothetical protein
MHVLIRLGFELEAELRLWISATQMYVSYGSGMN